MYKELKKKTFGLERMSKAIEESKLTVLIKGIIYELDLYRKFMCMDKKYDKNKKNLPPLTFHPNYSFLNC